MRIEVELDRSIITDKLYHMGIDMGYSLDYIQFTQTFIKDTNKQAQMKKITPKMMRGYN